MKTLDINSNFLALEEKDSNYKDSKIAILSVPYEHTVSYGGGTAKGPEAILKASHFVEFYDDEFDKEVCFEQGISTLESLSFNNLKDKEALNYIADNVRALLNDDKFVITLGGEHTISSAPIKAHYEKYPNMSILQFDAHSDLREEYQDNPYSHASIMARVKDFFPANRITQLGIRALCIEESVFIKENKVNTFFASAVRTKKHGDNWVENLVNTLNNEVYVTFDVDFFDPSIMPSTGTPEPDGFLYSETIDVFREMKRQGKKIIGFDVVELAPDERTYHPDLLTARLIYKMLNFCF